jgi:hypothetical protein
MNNDAIHPTGPTADRATARLGPSLHVKGEISGNEDLYIDGTVERAVQLGEGKLTVGATANVTADIIAREVVVRGKVKGRRRLGHGIGLCQRGATAMAEEGGSFRQILNHYFPNATLSLFGVCNCSFVANQSAWPVLTPGRRGFAVQGIFSVISRAYTSPCTWPPCMSRPDASSCYVRLGRGPGHAEK